MNLTEFKIIFYWEYFHRILGRFIGIFFLIPLLYFHFTKKIKRDYILTCYIIFFLILTQGIIGWYMVKSGLVNDVTVSHYRLSLHLSTALIIISSIFWLIINIKNDTHKGFFIIAKKNIIFQILFFLILLQVILGAFVSGLDAGKIYQTWPLMGHSIVPNDLILKNFNNNTKKIGKKQSEKINYISNSLYNICLENSHCPYRSYRINHEITACACITEQLI